MRIATGILSLFIMLGNGCAGQPTTSTAATVTGITAPTEIETAVDRTTANAIPSGSPAGATFVSIDPLNDDGTATGITPNANRTVSFTTDTVTRTDANGKESGTFASIDKLNWSAGFGSGSASFSIDGDNMIWDGLTYQRVATSKFDSRKSLISFFDGSTYNTVGSFDTGEDAFGKPVSGKWSVQFADNRIVLSIGNTVSVGTYSFIDGSSFKIDALFDELTAYVLNNDQLVIDSIVYQREAGKFN